MNEAATWPAPLLAHLRDMHGEPRAVTRLGGMSVARVYRVDFAAGSVVVKVSPRPAETRYYEDIAGRLRGAGVPIPHMEWSAHREDGHWLVLEYLPEPMTWAPAEAWKPHPAVIATLARLHRATRGWPADAHPAPPYAWTDATTDSALACIPREARRRVTPALCRLQHEAARLTVPWCWISGDASPPNWGARADGEAVLFDWELFRPGTPAADLAPTVPGLPSPAHVRLTASSYLQASGQAGDVQPWSSEELSRDIALAKLVTVAMLLAAHTDGRARIPREYIGRLVGDLPDWLDGQVW